MGSSTIGVIEYKGGYDCELTIIFQIKSQLLQIFGSLLQADFYL